MTSSQPSVLQFQPFQSAIEVDFWAEFTRRKLDHLKLSEDPLAVRDFSDVPSPLQLDARSLDNEVLKQATTRTSIPGELLNLNTLDSFKKTDHAALLHSVAERIWADIQSGATEDDPGLLSRFLLLSHAELKSYNYYYWFAFPALKPPSPFQVQSCISLASGWGAARSSQAVALSQTWLSQQSAKPPFWLMVGPDLEIAPLSSWQQMQSICSMVQSAAVEKVVGMLDPSNLAKNPGWPLRNLLLLAAARWKLREATVVCFRSKGGRFCPNASLLLRVNLPDIPDGWPAAGKAPQAVGWQHSPAGRLGPRRMPLAAALDPRHLAEDAAALNLKLIKWRAAPALDLGLLAGARCLLLGAGASLNPVPGLWPVPQQGTLGCAVARTLLGWGVRRITLVDNGRVSYSNPVRQSLYDFEDCLDGGAAKAEAAARKLASIYPGVEAAAVQLHIPMPGHSLADVELPEAKAATEQLEKLVKDHEAIFLLTDTRESRWLPTLLCATYDKLAINAALGFESYLVMRHGCGPKAVDIGGKPRLGCYFCNDVVAPLNSTADRTLDQQCTVARPGLAPIAGALAVELMAAVLQASSASCEAPLGRPVHMIRGQLSNFSQTSLTGQAFRQCTACSAVVVDEYRKRGWAWLLTALQDPRSLEDLTGLTQLKQSIQGDDLEVESLDSEDHSNEEDFINL